MDAVGLTAETCRVAAVGLEPLEVELLPVGTAGRDVEFEPDIEVDPNVTVGTLRTEGIPQPEVVSDDESMLELVPPFALAAGSGTSPVSDEPASKVSSSSRFASRSTCSFPSATIFAVSSRQMSRSKSDRFLLLPLRMPASSSPSSFSCAAAAGAGAVLLLRGAVLADGTAG